MHNIRPMPPAEPRKLTAGQVATILGVDRSTVIRWARKGLLPSEAIPGPKRAALRLFDPADVEALRDERIAKAVALLEATPGVARVKVTKDAA